MGNRKFLWYCYYCCGVFVVICDYDVWCVVIVLVYVYVTCCMCFVCWCAWYYITMLYHAMPCHTIPHEQYIAGMQYHARRVSQFDWISRCEDVTRCDMILLLFGNKLMWGRHVTWCTFGEDETVNYTRRFNELILIWMEGMNVNNSGYSTVMCRQKHQSPSAVSQEHLIITTRTWYDIHGVLFHLYVW